MSARPRSAPARAPSHRRRASRAAVAATLAAGLAGVAAPAVAQQSTGGQSMTLEELEDYIAEQKAALERVERNREITRDKEARVREELERREARREELERELRTLCEERVSVAAGDVPDDCEPDPAG